MYRLVAYLFVLSPFAASIASQPAAVDIAKEDSPLPAPRLATPEEVVAPQHPIMPNAPLYQGSQSPTSMSGSIMMAPVVVSSELNVPKNPGTDGCVGKSAWQRPVTIAQPQVAQVRKISDFEALGGKGTAAWTRPHFFQAAASFPTSDFESGATASASGLTIFEGMQVRFSEHGDYLLEFRTSAPEVPATIQLKLELQTPSGSITLLRLPKTRVAPTEMGGLATKSSHRRSRSHFVSYRGNSPSVKQCFRYIGTLPLVLDSPSPNCQCKLTRQGSAEFGYGAEMLR